MRRRVSTPESDARMMRHAIELAELGLGSTSPNPIVGAVIVGIDGTVVGQGFHARAGEPHAEVVALRDAGGRAQGATAFVTLEPCRHTGRTPPCTQALIDAGVTRVVYAVEDPDPVAGHGATDLRAAGIDVEAGVLREEAARSNAAWLHSTRTGRPYVTWKYRRDARRPGKCGRRHEPLDHGGSREARRSSPAGSQ